MKGNRKIAEPAKLPASGDIAILTEVIRENQLRVLVSSFGLILVALLEGISILTLLPLLAVAMGEQSSLSGTGIEAWIENAVDWTGLEPSVEIFLILIVAVIALKTAISMVVLLYVSYRQADIIREKRLKLLRSSLLAEWEYFLGQAPGKLANAIGREAQQAGRLFQSACNMISCLSQAAVYISVAILISWQVTIGATVVGLAMLVVLAGLIKRMRAAGVRQTNLMASFTSRLIDSLQGIKPLKAMGIVGRLEVMLSDDIHGMRDVFARLTFLKQSLSSLQELIRVIALAVTLYLVIRFTEQSLAALAVVAVLFIRTLDVARKLQKELQVMAVTGASYLHVAELTAKAAGRREHTGGARKPTLKKAICLDEVDFSYEGKPVFDGLSLDIPAGKFTCILGPSGAGKTTLLDLVIGLLAPSGGVITLDEIPLEEIDNQAWRNNIGYVPQDVILFHDTLMKNVTLGDSSLTETDVRRSLRDAGALEFVEALPQGLDTILGERGGRLSGGQRQRISIARALVRRPKLLILDEASSALDTATESEVAGTLGKLAGNMTILAITHRPTLVSHADLVYYLRDGRLENRQSSPSSGNRSSSPLKADG